MACTRYGVRLPASPPFILMSKVNLGDNALDVFKSFIRALQEQLASQNFDLILVAGDSGAVMVEFTKIIYKVLDKDLPEVVLLPVYRYSNATEEVLRQQEKTLEQEAAKQLNGTRVNRVLFVDDEIGSGDTLTASLRAIMVVSESQYVHCTVLAENDSFSGTIDIPAVKIDFQPFSKHKGVYNAVFWFIPSEYEQPVERVLSRLYPNVDSSKWPMNVLLDAPIKQIANGKAAWSNEVEAKVKAELANLPELQQSFRSYIEDIIIKTIKN